jgi:formamidopyrimidine-DNA glycosylase
MPELPEVETIRNILCSSPLIGKTIVDVDLLWTRTLARPSPQEFIRRTVGQSVIDIRRRGKFLIFHLAKQEPAGERMADSSANEFAANWFALIHLRMSGDLLLEPAGDPLPPHPRLILYLEGGLRLVFNDARKFGRAWLVSDPDTVLKNLGPEPLDPGWTPQDLYHALQSHHRQLKPLLLDQTFLAGLGNIYADESLHLAHLHPLTLSHHLSYPQAERLWGSIRSVLEEGIRRNGASIDWVYRGGEFQNYFRVYQRTGEPCLECGAQIVRITVGQRGTHFCPVCQPISL